MMADRALCCCIVVTKVAIGTALGPLPAGAAALLACKQRHEDDVTLLEALQPDWMYGRSRHHAARWSTPGKNSALTD